MTPRGLELLPVRGLPEVTGGDDLAGLIAGRADLRDGDVVVVSQKIVSKAEGAVAWPRPGEDLATARRRLARQAATRVVAETARVLIVETAHGLVCANAGVDASNVPGSALTLLPADPDATAARLRSRFEAAVGGTVGVVIADTFGRPWRTGQTDVAIGVAGLPPIRDERGARDRDGRVLEVTEVAVADEVAAAADLVRTKADGVPAVVVRGLAWQPDGSAGARQLVRDRAEDLFPRGRGALRDVLDHAAPPGPVPPADLDAALAVARRAGGERVDVAPRSNPPAVVVVRGEAAVSLEAGAAAATLVAALVEAGHAARWRRAAPGEDALAVVEAGPQRPGTATTTRPGGQAGAHPARG